MRAPSIYFEPFVRPACLYALRGSHTVDAQKSNYPDSFFSAAHLAQSGFERRLLRFLFTVFLPGVFLKSSVLGRWPGGSIIFAEGSGFAHRARHGCRRHDSGSVLLFIGREALVKDHREQTFRVHAEV
jgi:hypothetical protein